MFLFEVLHIYGPHVLSIVFRRDFVALKLPLVVRILGSSKDCMLFLEATQFVLESNNIGDLGLRTNFRCLDWNEFDASWSSSPDEDFSGLEQASSCNSVSSAESPESGASNSEPDSDCDSVSDPEE